MIGPTPNGPNVDDLRFQQLYGFNYFTFGITANPALTTLQTVSSSAGRFGGFLSIINVNAAPAYIQCFDTTATVTLGTTQPSFIIPIPAATTAALGAIFTRDVSIPLAAGLQVAATTTSNGATAVSTGLTGSLLYL